MTTSEHPASRGGIVLRVDDALVFLPASIAVKVAPPPRVAHVAGAPSELLGIALHEGQIMPVLAIGQARSSMVVCTFLGELVGLVGGTVVGTGMFEATGERGDVVVGGGGGGERAKLLDLTALYARVQSSGWAGRWGG